jgi:hypothetical protein
MMTTTAVRVVHLKGHGVAAREKVVGLAATLLRIVEGKGTIPHQTLGHVGKGHLLVMVITSMISSIIFRTASEK